MVKKLQKMARKQATAGSGLFDSQLAGTVRESAQQIWLAGLGAFSKAQEEGGKMFDTLVREGTSLQQKTQGLAGDKIGEMTQKMSSMAGEVTAKAGAHWDKLESIFEERTARAMRKLGVPTKGDVDALVARIDELSAKLATLSRTPVAAKRAAAKKAVAPARRPARKSAGA
ncbi:MAG TPA: phasin family protein [Ideonella sp.]|nr:phasin family protein [Ideonella sp.]